jgi:hypothetical protein
VVRGIPSVKRIGPYNCGNILILLGPTQCVLRGDMDDSSNQFVVTITGGNANKTFVSTSILRGEQLSYHVK